MPFEYTRHQECVFKILTLLTQLLLLNLRAAELVFMLLISKNVTLLQILINRPTKETSWVGRRLSAILCRRRGEDVGEGREEQ